MLYEFHYTRATVWNEPCQFFRTILLFKEFRIYICSQDKRKNNNNSPTTAQHVQYIDPKMKSFMLHYSNWRQTHMVAFSFRISNIFQWSYYILGLATGINLALCNRHTRILYIYTWSLLSMRFRYSSRCVREYEKWVDI